jgi:hypothetical protein
MPTQSFQFTGAVELTYDENSPHFQEALASFREVITGEQDTTAQQMLQHVASNLNEWGDHRRMVEGIGFVPLVDDAVPQQNWSGIKVAANYDERHFD